MERKTRAVCNVCRQHLGNYGNCPSPHEKRLCVTRCGHVFHLGCVLAWWRMMAPPGTHFQNDVDVLRLATSYTCPFCGSLQSTPRLFQIFLSFVEDEVEVEVKSQEEDVQQKVELQKKIEKLETEKAALVSKLENRATSLQRDNAQSLNSAAAARGSHFLLARRSRGRGRARGGIFTMGRIINSQPAAIVCNEFK